MHEKTLVLEILLGFVRIWLSLVVQMLILEQHYLLYFQMQTILERKVNIP